MDNRVKRLITLELSREGAFRQLPISEMLETYEKFVSLETPVEKGVRSDWMDNVTAFYQSPPLEMKVIHNNLINSETFFKKVLYVLDEAEYDAILRDPALGLRRTMQCIGLLRLIPANVNVSSYDWRLLQNPIQKAIVRTYQLRCHGAHTSDEWSVSDMLGNINAIMISTIRAVWDNRRKIQAITSKVERNNYGIDAHLKKTVREYKKKLEDGFRYVPLLWESEDRNSPANKPKRMDFQELADEKQVMLISDAGCGKTTALEYLEYQDAESYLSGESQFIPVRLTLIDEDAHLSLQDMICKKLNIPTNYCEELLRQGLLHLLIDGLNELSMDIAVKRDFLVTLEKFLSLYHDVFAVISDRRYSPIRLHLNQKYILKKMTKEDILRYAKSKPEYDSKVAAQLSSILDKPGFCDLEYTPLLVNQLITIFSSDATPPEGPTELVGIYLDALIRREYEEKRDLNAAPGKLDVILMKLADEMPDEGGMPRLQALRTCTNIMRDLGVQADSDACLNLAVQLGILTQKGNYIDFISEEYKAYYFMRAIEEEL